MDHNFEQLMQSHYIIHRNSSIHYRQFGTGLRLLFCFHGYGRDSYTFSILERKLGKDFTIIAFDIPFHGMTQWKDELIFNPNHLVNFLLEIRKNLEKEHLKFTLLGFSMGGRIALYLTQLLPEKVGRLVLLAPDGLSLNSWRWFGSQTWIGTRLLHYTIQHPTSLKWIISKAKKAHLIHRNLADFINYYVYDENHRMVLYKRWMSMKRFKPATGKLKRLIKENKIVVKMLFGYYDRIIPAKGGIKFKKGIEELVTVEVVDAGHNLLSETHVGNIAQLLND